MSRTFSVVRYRRSDRENGSSWKVQGTAPDGQRIRRFFPTKAEAEAFADDSNTETTNVGWVAMGLADSQRTEAAMCFEKLASSGRTLTEAVDFYLAHLEQTERSVTVSDAVEELLEEKRLLNLSSKHMVNMRYHFRPVKEFFGTRVISTLARKEIEVWLHGRKLAPESFKSARNHLAMLFNHAVRNGQAKVNPVTDIALPKGKVKPIAVLTPGAMEALIEFAKEHHKDMIPAIVIQGFAGLRTEEVRRLDWKEVRLREGLIEVTAENSKTGQRRLVTIQPNLKAMLAKVSEDSGPVVPKCFNRCNASLHRLMKKAGHSFPKNGLRHSFASYHLADCEDAAKTALQMGHMGPGMLFEHYRALVTPKAASAWWSIGASGGKVKRGGAPNAAVSRG